MQGWSPPTQSLQPRASTACCSGQHEGLRQFARGGWPLSEPPRSGRGSRRGGLPTDSLGLVLAAPRRSMTCPTFENGGIRAAPAALALSLQAERTFQGQLHRPPPPHLQSPNSEEGGLRKGCPLSWGWGCLSVADLRLRTQEQDRGRDPHASPSTSPNSLTAAGMWLLQP